MDTPWINFKFDAGAFGNEIWMLLGEARSKCEHLARVPLPPDEARELHLVSLARGVQATTAIEGNTKSIEEIRSIMHHPSQQDRPGDYQEHEVRNVIDAYNDVVSQIQSGEVPQLTPEIIKRFNKQVLRNLDVSSHVVPGQIRNVSVVVGNVYRAPNASECESLLKEMCIWLSGPPFNEDGDMKIPAAILKASLAHLYIAWIHPFGDGNGRTARLCEYLVLVTSGVPTSAAHLISNHCNDTRDEYYRQLDRTSKTGGDIREFLRYCVTGFVRGLTEQLDRLYLHHFRVEWKEFVAAKVTGRDQGMRRRRSVIAESLLFHAPVTRREIPLLTPRLAEIYAISGPKTLARDLDALESVGLIRNDGGTYVACDEVLRQSLPFRL